MELHSRRRQMEYWHLVMMPLMVMLVMLMILVLLVH